MAERIPDPETHVWVSDKQDRSYPLLKTEVERTPDLYEVDEGHAVRDESGRLLRTVFHTPLGTKPTPPPGRANTSPRRRNTPDAEPTTNEAPEATNEA